MSTATLTRPTEQLIADAIPQQEVAKIDPVADSAHLEAVLNNPMTRRQLDFQGGMLSQSSKVGRQEKSRGRAMELGVALDGARILVKRVATFTKVGEAPAEGQAGHEISALYPAEDGTTEKVSYFSPGTPPTMMSEFGVRTDDRVPRDTQWSDSHIKITGPDETVRLAPQDPGFAEAQNRLANSVNQLPPTR